MARVNYTTIESLVVEKLRTATSAWGAFDVNQRRYKFTDIQYFIREADKETARFLLFQRNLGELFREISQIVFIPVSSEGFVLDSETYVLQVDFADGVWQRATRLTPDEFLLLTREPFYANYSGYWAFVDGMLKVRSLGSIGGNRARVHLVRLNQVPLCPSGMEEAISNLATYNGLRVRADNELEAKLYYDSWLSCVKSYVWVEDKPHEEVINARR